jgi:hypothetical protein
LPRACGFVNEGAFDRQREKVPAGQLNNLSLQCGDNPEVKRKGAIARPFSSVAKITAASVLTVLPAEADHSKSR